MERLDELLAFKLGPNRKILNIDTSAPPPSGGGSAMLTVKVAVQDDDGKEEILHLIAKKIPTSEFFRDVYKIQETFKKEVAFYEVIVPLLKEFQKEEGIKDVLDNFPKFYGARKNLNGGTEVDEDAIMLLEDLGAKGFRNSDYEKGFNLQLAQHVLEDLAKFHATMIAIKLKKPQLFKEKIRSLCAPFTFKCVMGIFETLKKFILTFPEIAHLADKATKFSEDTPTTYREPFGSVIHCDLWVNNVMNKIEKDGTVRNVFIDFQLYDYRSPAADVFFFLWTSVQKEVLEKHIDFLLKCYHQKLLNTLNDYKIDTKDFEYENFEKELKIEAVYEFGHALLFIFYLKVVSLATDDEYEALDVDDIDLETKEKIYFMIVECSKRGWL